jgi:hypothetical protein
MGFLAMSLHSSSEALYPNIPLKEAARLLGISDQQIKKYCEGPVPTLHEIRNGRLIFFSWHEVKKYQGGGLPVMPRPFRGKVRP